MPHLHHGVSGASPVLLILPILAALVYLRGWLFLRTTSLSVIEAWRAGSFVLGLFLIWVALASPIAVLDQASLTGHMIQHLLLMTFATPLILLSEPVMLLLHGLPRRFVRSIIGPLFRWRPIQQLGRLLAQSPLCWLAAVGALVIWHVPAAFTLGMQSKAWHTIEHASFLGTGFLFWWPVVQPWPGVSRRPDWSIILYLFLATLPCDVLSAFLVFSERVVYPVYLSASDQSSLTVLADQQCAGALMWTCVTIVYLVAGAICSTRLLSPQSCASTAVVTPLCAAEYSFCPTSMQPIGPTLGKTIRAAGDLMLKRRTE
jgi:cytochrome c oxidase assembly factor CtaG